MEKQYSPIKHFSDTLPEPPINVYDNHWFEVFELMAKRGGHFASQLAEAWFCADTKNKYLIIETWSSLIKSYDKKGQD